MHKRMAKVVMGKDMETLLTQINTLSNHKNSFLDKLMKQGHAPHIGGGTLHAIWKRLLHCFYPFPYPISFLRSCQLFFLQKKEVPLSSLSIPSLLF